MISREQIEIFIKYSGDSDFWARGSTKKERSILSEAVWIKLESFLNKIALIKTGNASSEFVNSTEKILASEIGDNKLIQRLYELE